MRWPDLIFDCYPPRDWRDVNVVVVEWVDHARRNGRTAPPRAKIDRVRTVVSELMRPVWLTDDRAW